MQYWNWCLYFWRGYDYCCVKFVSTSLHIRTNKLLSEWFSSSLLSRLYFSAVNIWWYVGNNKFSEQKTITSFSPKLSIDIFLRRFDYFCQEAQTAAAAAPTQQNSINKTSRHISNQLIQLWMKLMRDSREDEYFAVRNAFECALPRKQILIMTVDIAGQLAAANANSCYLFCKWNAHSKLRARFAPN